MPLKKSVGNMYPWVTHTHSHLGGECPHNCVYCYVKSFPFRPAKYQGPVRLIESELSVQYGTGKTIFIEHCNDLFAEGVPDSVIYRIITHCEHYPENTYVFQSKNPERMVKGGFPNGSILGTTIETNRPISRLISTAPLPVKRYVALAGFRGRKFVTIEPVMDFDLNILSDWIYRLRPEFVNIGADSKGHDLPEPSGEKVRALIGELTRLGIEIRKKDNLGRLMR